MEPKNDAFVGEADAVSHHRHPFYPGILAAELLTCRFLPWLRRAEDGGSSKGTAIQIIYIYYFYFGRDMFWMAFRLSRKFSSASGARGHKFRRPRTPRPWPWQLAVGSLGSGHGAEALSSERNRKEEAINIKCVFCPCIRVLCLRVFSKLVELLCKKILKRFWFYSLSFWDKKI